MPTAARWFALTATEGCSHVVRVEAVDRFGTLVSAEKRLVVSGDDDEIKLRLLSDRQQYEVGDTVRVQIANRAGTKLALRTIQGDGILAYDTAVLPEGHVRSTSWS